MLYVQFGERDDVLQRASKAFNVAPYQDWMEDPLVKEMVADIDGGEVLYPEIIKSRFGNMITPKDLSGGLKILIMAYKDPKKVWYPGSSCGSNCAPWFLRIAEKKDVYITLGYYMNFGSLDTPMTVTIVNDGTVVHNYNEFLGEQLKWDCEGVL